MKDTTYERDSALRPLSRDHGVLLVLVQRLRKAADATQADRISLANELREKFASLVEQYLSDENVSLGTVEFDERVRCEVLDDHAKIIGEVKYLASVPNSRLTSRAFNELANLIEGHVRWEERVLLPYLRDGATKYEWTKLAQTTSTLEAKHARPIKKLHHSITLDKNTGLAQTCSCCSSLAEN